MAVHRGLAAGDRLGESDSVYDRGMIELVADDNVILAEQGAGNGLISIPATDEAQARLGTHQTGAGCLEGLMHREGPADKAH